MTGLQPLESVRFVSANNRRVAVPNADDWEALIEWLETLDDGQVARSAIERLKAAGGDRDRAGRLSWDTVSDQLR